MANIENHYREIFDSYSSEQLRNLAQVKRFMERLVADLKFLNGLTENMHNLIGFAESYGLKVDPNLMLPLFSREHMKYRHTDEEAQWPLS